MLRNFVLRVVSRIFDVTIIPRSETPQQTGANNYVIIKNLGPSTGTTTQTLTTAVIVGTPNDAT